MCLVLGFLHSKAVLYFIKNTNTTEEEVIFGA